MRGKRLRCGLGQSRGVGCRQPAGRRGAKSAERQGEEVFRKGLHLGRDYNRRNRVVNRWSCRAGFRRRVRLASVVVRDLPQRATELHRGEKTSEILSWRDGLQPLGGNEPGFLATEDWRINRSVPDGPHALFLCETLWPSVVNL
jgi:hypothetical protein